MLRVLHPITRLIIGGAQENTMLTADYHTHLPEFSGKYQVDVVSGPQTGPEGSLIDEVRQRGTNLTIMPEMRREVSPANDLKAVWKLRQMMIEGKYDIVHTHSSKAGVIGRLAAKWAGVPLVVHTVHGWSYHEHMSPGKKNFYVALEKIGYRNGDAMVTVSPKDIDKGLAEGIGRREDYTVIRSGIELDRFGQVSAETASNMRRSLGIPADALVIGSVTRLSEQKDPLNLVEALAQVHKHRPDIYSVIVGDGLLRGEVEAKIKQFGLTDRILLTGLRRDVPELMATFDLFVLSSLWEGLPRVLPQAMATGLPIICTRADGSAEAVVDGLNGFLVEPRSPDQIAEKAVLLLTDSNLRQKMGAAGKERVPMFGARKMVQDIDELYTRLMKQKK
ncbi:MAG: glycosyltransferase family 4 protein [Anaerolineae bacterium]